MVTGNKINSPPSGPTGRSGADAYPSQRLSKAEHVYHHLREAILAGTLEPGTLIDKTQLCDELNVSRFPVTTAINRLAFERLVVIEPQHGSFVSKISAQDAREFLMIRRALEADIAAQAAVALPQDAREALARNIRYQHAAAEAEDSTGFYALDVDFPQTIVSGLRLTQSSDILKGLRAHAERVRRLLAPPKSRLLAIFNEHNAVWQSIEAQNEAAAGAAMRAHLSQTIAIFETVVRDRPALFSLNS